MFGIIAALAATATVALAPSAATPSPFERAVLERLNAARADPAAMAALLQARRTRYDGLIERLPTKAADMETVEGVVPVDEAVVYLSRISRLGSLSEAPVLRLTASDHVSDQARTGRTGHRGGDGSMPWDRSTRHGGGRHVAEVITYGSDTPEDVVEDLIVDDGVPDRGHRNIVYDPRLRYAGVSCGPHPQYRIMCVVDLAITPDGDESDLPLRPIEVASAAGTR